MIKVRTKDHLFELSGDVNKVGPLRMCSLFGWSRYFYNAPRGQKDLGRARAMVQRQKALGFDGGRIFDETHSHGQSDHPYWKPISSQPWDLNQPVAGSRFKLRDEQKRAYEDQNKMLVDEKFIVERVINATVKESPEGIESVDRTVAYWERMQREVMQFMSAQGFENQLYENCNEFEAHTSGKVLKKLRFDENEVDLVVRMALRAREDHAGVPYGISHGGRWTPLEYPVQYSGANSSIRHSAKGGGFVFYEKRPTDYRPSVAESFTHVNVHTPRGATWWDTAVALNLLISKFPTTPIYQNENMFLSSVARRDFWASKGYTTPWDRGSARADIPKHVAEARRQWQTAFSKGVSYCFHGEEGTVADPDLPLSGFERAWQEDFGSGELPPPPPPPPPVGREEAYVGRTYHTVLNRHPDEAGWNHHALALGLAKKKIETASGQELLDRLRVILPELELFIKMSKGPESRDNLKKKR